jgi:myo-inositol 2-dehydrogenase/D-chiro-inositol 1-dehydrogenase
MKKEKPVKKQNKMDRRQFITGVGAAAVSSFFIVNAKSVKGTAANSRIRLGLIGCGGRGVWITNLFSTHNGYEITACADYFKDRIDQAGTKFNIPESARFMGMAGYKRLIESKLVDAVAIESPPYFHPEQASSAVDAGLHVYLAKPIAVDVPGCFSIEKSAKKAGSKNLVFLIDFQTRANEYFIEALKRVYEGALGTMIFGESTYHAECPFQHWFDMVRKEPDNPEVRLHCWGLDRALSGDIITEQNIHTLDVATWILNQAPIYAIGTGGLKSRDVGTIWDHFVVYFQFPNNVGINFSSYQFEGHGTQNGIRNRMFGSEGVLETEYGGQVLIRGNNFYRGGKTSSIYQEGAENNIKTFHESVTNGNYTNPTVVPSVRSNLTTILGRTAAYEGRQIYWYQLLNDKEKWHADLSGLQD